MATFPATVIALIRDASPEMTDLWPSWAVWGQLQVYGSNYWDYGLTKNRERSAPLLQGLAKYWPALVGFEPLGHKDLASFWEFFRVHSPARA